MLDSDMLVGSKIDDLLTTKSGNEKRRHKTDQRCEVGCHMWDTKMIILVDITELGNSLPEHGMKA